ncbi:DUF268 domain-containing protein [Polynucleobacter paneuropaeus]|nr:DUF268 domain-containing protein [Polynucleobacter paneuropaeus]
MLEKLVKRLGLIVVSLGFDPRRLLLSHYIPRYLLEYKNYKKLGGVITHKAAIFSDYEGQAGSAKGHYFHQDLLIASFIYKNTPLRHIDVGSRIDGFVAHVASFRKIEVMDIRDLKGIEHQNISFIQADLMNKEMIHKNITDSISCLHAIEHFGLGRYGDRLDPNGHIQGFNNILCMLKPGGMLYISFPIGRSNEVHFNAHRVFNPMDIFTWAEDPSCLKLVEFNFVDDMGDLKRGVDIENQKINVSYGCGIYMFRKIH